jgi:hypothetical protein
MVRMDEVVSTLLTPPVLACLIPGLVLLAIAVVIRRRARADRTILDAFELGGRMSLDPVEVTGSRLLQRRIRTLQDLGLLKATPRGMLVPEIDALKEGIAGGKRKALWLLVAGLLAIAAGLMLGKL